MQLIGVAWQLQKNKKQPCKIGYERLYKDIIEGKNTNLKPILNRWERFLFWMVSHIFELAVILKNDSEH